jgi:hypothetical protein
MSSDYMAVLDYEPVTLDFGMSLSQQCDAIWSETRKQIRAERRLREAPPVTMIWDGDWNPHYQLTQEYGAEFSFISNDSGPGKTVIPFDTAVAQWIHDMQGRIDRGEKRNVHITVDHVGARWGGRLDSASVKLSDDGDRVLECIWLHDFENLKWYSVWSNPFLPAIFQAPRAFVLAGPVPWILKLSLHFALLREHNPLITIPDDPLDWESYLDAFRPEQWQVMVKPTTFLTEMLNGSIWGMIHSRWATWYDMAKQMLEDSEYSVEVRRWLTGDPIPYYAGAEDSEGFEPRNGTLVMDILDKSGVYVGTSHGGRWWDGILRTASEFSEDFIDSTANIIQDTTVPQEYFIPGLKLTKKELPYVIYEEGAQSGIQTSDLIVSPAKGVQVNCGGHSAPGVNEAISASVQAAFDVIGGIAQIGSLGGTVDTLIRPLYEDVIAAFWSTKSLERAQNAGWSRYFEYWAEGASKAYTLAALMVIRAGYWATRTTISVKLAVVDGAPFTIGDQGLGHHWLDDRIGFLLKDDPRGVIHMDRCRRIDMAWDEENPRVEFQLTIGDDRALQDPAQRAWGKIENIVAALRDLGVY